MYSETVGNPKLPDNTLTDTSRLVAVRFTIRLVSTPIHNKSAPVRTSKVCVAEDFPVPRAGVYLTGGEMMSF